MACELCGSQIRRGQFYVQVKAFVTVRDGHNQPIAEPVVLEDGSSAKYAHYGCMMKRCPMELMGMGTGTIRP